MPMATPVATDSRSPQALIVPALTSSALMATAMRAGSARVVANPIAAPNT